MEKKEDWKQHDQPILTEEKGVENSINSVVKETTKTTVPNKRAKINNDFGDIPETVNTEKPLVAFIGSPNSNGENLRSKIPRSCLKATPSYEESDLGTYVLSLIFYFWKFCFKKLVSCNLFKLRKKYILARNDFILDT